MAFHKSSKDIEVVDGHLIATCTDCLGGMRESKLHLDAHLGNSNGFFEWGGGGFSRSATDIEIRREGDSCYLYARLRTQHKSWRDAKVNLSDRITNSDGVLQYIGGKEPQIEYSRDFLGEERDFISAAISDTISDLREIFTGIPLFEEPAHSRQGRNTFVPREQPEPSRRNVPIRTKKEEDQSVPSSHIRMEDSTASVRTSVPDEKDASAAPAQASVSNEKEEPPAYDFKAAPVSRSGMTRDWTNHTAFPMPESAVGESTIGESSVQQVIYHNEEQAMQEVQEFLFSGNGNMVRSSKAGDGKRVFELRSGQGELHIIRVQESACSGQDELRRGSMSEASVRCMTPSVVDGEDEYDFLN